MAASFAKDQAAYYRSQGWKELDEKQKARNKHIYDKAISSAGDDKVLTHDEYKNIFTDRGDAWGKIAYDRDAIAAALAEAGTSGGIKLDANARYMRDNDLAFDGDDILLRADGGWDDFDDDLRSSGKARFERMEEDGDDDYWNIYRYSGLPAVVEKEKEKEEVVNPVTPDPVVITPDKELLDQRKDWEENANPLRTPEPKVGGRGYGSKDDDPMPIRMDDWMKIGVNPGRRLGIDLTPMEQLGSIPFVTSGQYQSSLNQTIPAERKSRFYGFLDGTPGGAVSNYEDLLEKMRT